MKRAVLVISLLALVACTRERVVIVHEPAADKNAVVNDGSPIGADGERPTNEDEPDWGIKNPSDAQEYSRVIGT